MWEGLEPNLYIYGGFHHHKNRQYPSPFPSPHVTVKPPKTSTISTTPPLQYHHHILPFLNSTYKQPICVGGGELILIRQMRYYTDLTKIFIPVSLSNHLIPNYFIISRATIPPHNKPVHRAYRGTSNRPMQLNSTQTHLL